MSCSWDLQASAERFARRLHDVQDVQIPRLKECAAVDKLAEYEQELHSSLGNLASMVRQLTDDVEDAVSGEERAALEEIASNCTRQLERCAFAD